MVDQAEEDIISCENKSGKNKPVEFLCRIARNMQENDIHVSFSEIEDTLVAIHNLDTQIRDSDDLKSVVRVNIAKNEKASRVFNTAYDKAMKATFRTKSKGKTEKEIEEGAL
jgi:hypothetical protein